MVLSFLVLFYWVSRELFVVRCWVCVSLSGASKLSAFSGFVGSARIGVFVECVLCILLYLQIL